MIAYSFLLSQGKTKTYPEKGMQLTQQDIDEFKATYRQHFGKDLPDEQAWPMARNLLYLFSMIYRPVPDGEKDEDNDRE